MSSQLRGIDAGGWVGAGGGGRVNIFWEFSNLQHYLEHAIAPELDL